MTLLGRSFRLVQLSLTTYVFAAVVFTTFRLACLPLRAIFPSIFEFSSSQLSSSQDSAWSSLSPVSVVVWLSRSITHSTEPTSSSEVDVSRTAMRFQEHEYWNSSILDLAGGIGQAERVSLPETLFLSKAFASSMHPSNIVPFYYRSSGQIDPEDITITTLITSNRLRVFAQLTEHYEGPISVTIHVENTTERIHDVLNQLHELYTSHTNMATQVDVHLVIDSFDRQFNTWRNIARLFARTNYVLMLDVDFALCTDFRQAIRNSVPILNKLQEGYSAFVLPAFEYVKLSEGTNQSTFPKDKASLVNMVRAGRLGIFHPSWAAGHNSTDYDRYYNAKPGEVYKVTRYQPAYEPYVVFRKEGPPWCDERFVGYGGNKAACLFEMYLSGVSFYVLADHFIIHQNHLYEETVRKMERKYNRKLYSDFKEETCLRYLRGYHQHKLLNTTRGQNLLNECPKIKGVARMAAQIIGEHSR